MRDGSAFSSNSAESSLSFDHSLAPSVAAVSVAAAAPTVSSRAQQQPTSGNADVTAGSGGEGGGDFLVVRPLQGSARGLSYLDFDAQSLQRDHRRQRRLKLHWEVARRSLAYVLIFTTINVPYVCIVFVEVTGGAPPAAYDLAGIGTVVVGLGMIAALQLIWTSAYRAELRLMWREGAARAAKLRGRGVGDEVSGGGA